MSAPGLSRPELSRPVPVDRVGTGGLERLVEASGPELEALAARLAIPAVLAFRCRFVLRRGRDEARGEVLAEGELTARLVRECVVSLDEFEAEMASEFRLKLVRAGTERDSDDPEEDDELPYEGSAIDLGEVAAEQLALDLDPYPRKPGVALDAADDEVQNSVFAALRRRLE